MQAFQGWLTTSPIASWLRSFVAIVLTQAVAEWTTTGAFTFGNYQTWLLAGAVAIIPVIVRWLNPSDTAFGRGSK